jgi:hypothetical protein
VSRLIIVTHQNRTMEVADTLYLDPALIANWKQSPAGFRQGVSYRLCK